MLSTMQIPLALVVNTNDPVKLISWVEQFSSAGIKPIHIWTVEDPPESSGLKGPVYCCGYTMEEASLIGGLNEGIKISNIKRLVFNLDAPDLSTYVSQPGTNGKGTKDDATV